VEWADEGIVLSARRHGESAAVVHLLTRAHGRHAGLVRGGAGPRGRGLYQTGNRVSARWRARLAEHLGAFTGELIQAHAAALIDDPLRLSALSAACAVADATLPERQPYPTLFDALAALIDTLHGSTQWPAAYVRWELGLLDVLGFGLDLGACAATGRNDDLAYVSPKTGRAVSLAAGAPYRDRLLPLPGFLIGRGGADAAAVRDGLRLTGWFLDRHVFAPHNRRMPPARERFVERFSRIDTTSGGISAQ